MSDMNDTNNVKQIKIRRESLFQSIVNDIFSLGTLGFLFWFNYNFIGNSYLVNFIIMLLLFFFIIKTAIIFNKGDDKRFLDYKGVSDEKIEKIINILEERN